MSFAGTNRGGATRPVVWLAVLALAAASVGIPPGWAQQKATITGTVLDTAGAPQAGCQIVVLDTSSDTEYRSARTGADGVYSIEVPVGPRYAFLSVIDPAGRKHPLDLSPLAVTLPAKLTRNIRIVPSEAVPPEDDDSKPQAWWRTNGKWVGIGVGVVAVLAAAGGGDDDSVSPSEPE